MQGKSLAFSTTKSETSPNNHDSLPLAAARLYPLAAARLYRVAILNYLFVFPRDTIAREQGSERSGDLD